MIVLVVVLAAASAAGWGIRVRNGRFRAQGSSSLTEDDLGVALGERATLVQFSTEFVLGPDGSIARRAAGKPRRSEVLAAVSSVLDAAPRGVESDSGAAGE